MLCMPLPQHPARVLVTLADDTDRWLADPPEAPWGSDHRWRFVDDLAQAGVWSWQEAVQLERQVRQQWRRQYARAVRVGPVELVREPVYRADTGDRARERARVCGVPDPEGVAWVTFTSDGVRFGYADDREPVVLPPITV
jgi:hypothetical protein